jgi:hypothetical protein
MLVTHSVPTRTLILCGIREASIGSHTCLTRSAMPRDIGHGFCLHLDKQNDTELSNFVDIVVDKSRNPCHGLSRCFLGNH